MNQRKQAQHCVKEMLSAIRCEIDEPLRALNDVVQDAQNEPPDGSSDGTIDEETWHRLHDLVCSGEKFLADLQAMGIRLELR